MQLVHRAVALAAVCGLGWSSGATAQDIHPEHGQAEHGEIEPVEIGGTPVSLAALLGHALRSAPALSVAQAEIALADEDFGAADPFLPGNPTLTVAVGPRFGQDGGSDIDAQLSLMQPIELAGERPLRFDVARAARHTQEMRLARARWEVHQLLHAGYRAALVARGRAELARRIAHFQHDLVDITRRRVDAGEESPLNLRLAEAGAAQADQRAIAALQVYRETCLRLAEVAGWSARRPPEPLGEPSMPRPAPTLSRLLELARAHNPLLDVRRAAVREARARTSLAAREAWPTPSVGVQWSREGAPNGGAPQDSILGVLSLPIPSFVTHRAERAGAEARLDVALAQEAALLTALTARLERLRSAVSASRARVEAYGADILPRFAENLALLRRAFELGEIDILDLSTALERFLAIQLEALDAHLDYATAVAALEAEVGAELWPEEAR